jgi:hypothetical protein
MIAVGLNVSRIEKDFSKITANVEEDAGQIDSFKAQAARKPAGQTLSRLER